METYANYPGTRIRPDYASSALHIRNIQIRIEYRRQPVDFNDIVRNHQALPAFWRPEKGTHSRDLQLVRKSGCRSAI